MIEINDPIHKIITLSAREAKILDHPYMQRLRFIRQLGFVPLVYPSATHDRFSHALGTMHIAGLLSRHIFYNETSSALARILTQDEKIFLTEILRLAALLHDIGHAPFSHPAEKVMPPFQELKVPRGWYYDPKDKRAASHEDYSVLLIAGLAEGKDAILTEEEAEIIASLVHHKKIKIPACWRKHFSKKINPLNLHALVRSLISGNIDADRMDYLLRDSHFAGVTYGHFDLSWLISNLGVLEDGGFYVMSISDTGLHALEHYLFARYNMYIQVYMHKTVKCFEYYFQRALDLRETAYIIPADREAYARMKDATLIESLSEAAAQNPLSWSGRLMRREPAKRLTRIWGDRNKIDKIFKEISLALKSINVRPILCFSQSRFLDIPEMYRPYQTFRRHKVSRGLPSKAFGSKQWQAGIATTPIAVVRKHLGVISAVSLADYSFILKRYHRDISIGDIYVLREDYEKHRSTIQKVIKKYRTYSASELVLREEL
jgi:hypothetical protein